MEPCLAMVTEVKGHVIKVYFSALVWQTLLLNG